MAANDFLPPNYELVESFDETAGLCRVMDSRDRSQALLMKFCDVEHFDESAKAFCQEWMKSVVRQPVPALWSPKRLFLAKNVGVFALFQDLTAATLGQVMLYSDGTQTSLLLQSLSNIGRAIDLLHQRGQAHGGISIHAILVCEGSDSVLIDSRLKTELDRRRTASGRSAALPDDDRRAFASMLEQVLFENETVRESHFHGSRIREQQARARLAEFRAVSSETFATLLDGMVDLLSMRSENSGATRWEMVPEFLDDDGQTLQGTIETRSELPQIRSHTSAPAQLYTPKVLNPAIDHNSSTSRTGARAPQTVDDRQVAGMYAPLPASPPAFSLATSTSPASISQSRTKIAQRTAGVPSPQLSQAKTTDAAQLSIPATADSKPSGPSSRLIATTFLFSMMVLASVIGFKIIPELSGRSLVTIPPAPLNPVITPAAVQQKQKELAEAKQNAAKIGPTSNGLKAWKNAENESIAADRFVNAQQNTEFLDRADRAIKLYKDFESVAKRHQDYEAKLKDPANIEVASIDAALRRHAENEYQTAERTLAEGRDAAAKEDFVVAIEKFVEGQSQLRRLEFPTRLKAASTAESPEAKITLLGPVLDIAGDNREIISVICDVLDEDPRLWIKEAERRISKLAASEKIIAWSEVAEASHAMAAESRFANAISEAVAAVEQLPGTKDDNQVMSAVSRLLDVAVDLGKAPQQKRVSDAVAAWASSRGIAGIDASLIAGGCFRLNNLTAWETMTKASLSGPASGQGAEDLIATNVVTAFGRRVDSHAKNLLLQRTPNAPFAAALAAYTAATKNDPDAAAAIASAEKIVPPHDRSNLLISQANELLAAAKAIRSGDGTDSEFAPASRFKGAAAAAACQKKSMEGDLEGASKIWSKIPARSLIKSDATAALVQCGLRTGWKSKDIMEWANRQSNELDKIIAFVTAGVRNAEGAERSPTHSEPPKALKPGTVLTFKEVGSSKEPGSSSRQGGLGGGGSRVRIQPRLKNANGVRFYVRSVSEDNVVGFVEFPQRREIFFCTGTFSKNLLNCQMTPVVSDHSAFQVSNDKLLAIVDGQGGMLVNTFEDKDDSLSIAAYDGTQSIPAYSAEDNSRLQELEARLLVSQLANGQDSQKEVMDVLCWTRAPQIVINVSRALGTQHQDLADFADKCRLSLNSGKKAKGSFSDAKLVEKLDSNRGIFLSFDRMERHEKIAAVAEKATGHTIKWPSNSAFGYHYTFEGKNRSEMMYVMLQIDPTQFDKTQLERVIQNLWIRAMGLALRDELLAPLPIESTLTTHGITDPKGFKPLSIIDRKAIFIFLEELKSGNDPKMVKQILSERARKTWTFGERD